MRGEKVDKGPKHKFGDQHQLRATNPGVRPTHSDSGGIPVAGMRRAEGQRQALTKTAN